MSIKIGFGYDVHKLVENRKLIIGGVQIIHNKGLLGHSDADVLLHAISDALLGALALGDIGTHFPDTNSKYKDIDSKILLSEVNKLITQKGYIIGNIDSTICAQKPKLNEYIPSMRKEIANILKLDLNNISIKATTTENLGFIGREEGISAYCNTLLFRK